MDTGSLILSNILAYMSKKIVVPTDFHARVEAIRNMLEDDVSGLVDSLTDFSIESASVDFNIETDNEELSKILKKWLDEINSAYQGQIPSGIKALSKEYYAERWKYSSFPVLKIAKWESVNGIILPTRAFFVDGGSIYAKDKNEKDKELQLINYDYYLGQNMKEKNKLKENVIFNKPYGRWFDKYPNPYLIKRGVYHNWEIIESLKNKQSEILDQVIPYLFLVKKGTEALALKSKKVYSDPELVAIKEQFQNLIEELKNTGKSPFRASQFDEEIKHLIPDLSTIFNPTLFASAEKNILSGLGFIDIAEGISESRRQSILNPKVFIAETKSGVGGFKQIMKDLVLLIKKKNKNHKKYFNSQIYITASPVTAFMTDKFKDKIRQLYDRGNISKQTSVELIAEVDFETEVNRREQESKRGLDYTLYPPIKDNQEDKAIDIPGTQPAKPKDTDADNIPDDKNNPTEKKNYDIGSDNLETAPFKTLKSLPATIRKNLDSDLQKVFMNVFNKAHEQYKNDTRAFRVAWSVIKKLARKNKKGLWVRKNKRVDGKLKPVKLNKSMLEDIMEKEEKEAIDEAISLKQLEYLDTKNELAKKLLGKGK